MVLRSPSHGFPVFGSSKAQVRNVSQPHAHNKVTSSVSRLRVAQHTGHCCASFHPMLCSLCIPGLRILARFHALLLTPLTLAFCCAVVNQLVAAGFNSEDVKQSVCLDKHDHLNTAYQLLLHRMRIQQKERMESGSVVVGSPAMMLLNAHASHRPGNCVVPAHCTTDRQANCAVAAHSTTAVSCRG